MKNFIRKSANFVKNGIRKVREKVIVRTAEVICDPCGDLATNTIGGIIVAVVIVGLLVVAVRAFFPNFFSDMFAAMETRLNNNW